MFRMPWNRLSIPCVTVLLAVVACVPADAQYRPLPRSSSAGLRGASDVKGENYHIEISGNLWNPPPDFMFQSEGLGIDGTEIDLDKDLAIEQQPLYEARLVLRPTRKNKLRVHYLPMSFTGDTVLQKEIVFNGIRYNINSPVKTDFKWNAYRFTYEADVFYRERGYLGFLLEAKYADTNLTLENALSTEFVQAKAPIPAAGLAARVYPLRFLSITGEFTYFRLPDSVKDAKFSSLDFDVYGTVNLGNNLGIQGGYRSIDMAFSIDKDAGSIKLKGPYVGGVLRF